MYLNTKHLYKKINNKKEVMFAFLTKKIYILHIYETTP